MKRGAHAQCVPTAVSQQAIHTLTVQQALLNRGQKRLTVLTSQ